MKIVSKWDKRTQFKQSQPEKLKSCKDKLNWGTLIIFSSYILLTHIKNCRLKSAIITTKSLFIIWINSVKVVKKGFKTKSMMRFFTKKSINAEYKIAFLFFCIRLNRLHGLTIGLISNNLHYLIVLGTMIQELRGGSCQLLNSPCILEIEYQW
jgi:hypothetical protein